MAVDNARLPSGDAVSHRANTAKLLNVEMNEFARMFPFIAAHGFGIQGAQFVEPKPAQNTADSCRRDPDLGSDLLACPTLGGVTAQSSRQWLQGAAGASDVVATNDPPVRSSPRGDTDRPICAPSAGTRLRLRQRPAPSARPRPGSQFALDHTALDGHSCGCSSGPPRVTDASTTSVSPVWTGWTTY